MKLVNGKSESEELVTQKQGLIANVEKRLQLLYPGKHELIITNDDHVFVVDLKVELERKDHQLMFPQGSTPMHELTTIRCLIIDDGHRRGRLYSAIARSVYIYN
jgi:hypothetical protein